MQTNKPKPRGIYSEFSMITRIYLDIHALGQPVHRDVASRIAMLVTNRDRTDSFRRLATLVSRGLLERCGGSIKQPSGGCVFSHLKVTEKGKAYAKNCSKDVEHIRTTPVKDYGLIQLKW